ncbi:hypothetical protein [Glaciecola sp. KUL10]|jgi:hypothetical protein|uniref:hypothetical protein n=1 Tax=Glaciecola sp. (strain KUL10) TaxID=2161813 RepID=UPI00131414ED|nr:hypothetical protein [Glaciecola sp. KUL10]
MLFSLTIAAIVFGLLVFCMTESKGKNTIHARKSKPRVPKQIKTRMVDNEQSSNNAA